MECHPLPLDVTDHLQYFKDQPTCGSLLKNDTGGTIQHFLEQKKYILGTAFLTTSRFNTLNTSILGGGSGRGPHVDKLMCFQPTRFSGSTMYFIY